MRHKESKPVLMINKDATNWARKFLKKIALLLTSLSIIFLMVIFSSLTHKVAAQSFECTTDVKNSAGLSTNHIKTGDHYTVEVAVHTPGVYNVRVTSTTYPPLGEYVPNPDYFFNQIMGTQSLPDFFGVQTTPGELTWEIFNKTTPGVYCPLSPLTLTFQDTPTASASLAYVTATSLRIDASGGGSSSGADAVVYNLDFGGGKQGEIARVPINADPFTQTVDWPINSYARAVLYTCDTGTSNNCREWNEVDRSILENWNCPLFRAFNPSPPRPGDNIQLQYLPLSTGQASDFRVVINGDDTGTVLTDLSSSYGVWVASIGSFDAGTSLSIVLHSSGGDCPPVLLIITNSPPPSTGSGKNPCLDTNGDGKIDTCPTAIGNIPVSLGEFATAVLRIALGISGGIVLILMVIGSIRVMTSSGDPKNVAAGRDMIVAAVAGALFIAFSVMIMQFLGTAIVPIPGLTYGT